MKKSVVLFLNISFVVLSVFGQGNALYREIQQAKETNTYFENVVFTRASEDIDVLNGFTNPDEVSFFENSSFNSRNNETKAITLFIPIKTEVFVLELVEVPEYFYNYEIITSDWERFAANKDIKHFRGVVKDDEHSLAAITFYEDEVMGLIATSEGNLNIVKNMQSGKHLIYNDKNLKEKMDWVCDSEDDTSVIYDPEILLDQQHDLGNTQVPIRSTVINKIVKFYVETEYDIYQREGSVSAVEKYILGLFNIVAVMYWNEDIPTGVSYIYIWTSDASYPYTGQNTTTDLLHQFQQTRTSIIGDLGILLTSRTMGGRAAGYSGICNSSTKNKLAVAGYLHSDYEIVNNYSWSVEAITHEFGHLLGSKHTHACAWNGNNTAIDGCYSVEGSCSLPPIPPEGGTIMSYCHFLQSETYVGTNFNLGFGPQPGNVIRNKVNNSNCLQTCDLTINNETYNAGLYSILGCTIEISNTTIQPNTTVNIHGRESVTLKSGFHAMAGSNVRITAGGQTQVNTNLKSSIDNEVENEYENGNEYSHSPLEELAVKFPEIVGVDFSIYPNPNDGNFTVKITGKIQPYTIEVFNSFGGLLGYVNCNDEIVNINRTDLSAGIYFVKITMSGKIAVKKIIVQ